ncbi:hypothetical protein [Desulfovibrio psychrotolerans]|uniref:Uncharacterized protein n=1 Tax=Desulfovibrio psychrotolerans TaxID=415242 RepID=A0A7J0BQN1_9BACT|nr:hypothetical protein [Desulfovibrio psychrotolerans]GFM35968.1 hypothetical protein DSM19430T_06520 [Desulfovibrio psychrotolerans]
MRFDKTRNDIILGSLGDIRRRTMAHKIELGNAIVHACDVTLSHGPFALNGLYRMVRRGDFSYFRFNEDSFVKFVVDNYPIVFSRDFGAFSPIPCCAGMRSSRRYSGQGVVDEIVCIYDSLSDADIERLYNVAARGHYEFQSVMKSLKLYDEEYGRLGVPQDPNYHKKNYRLKNRRRP